MVYERHDYSDRHHTPVQAARHRVKIVVGKHFFAVGREELTLRARQRKNAFREDFARVRHAFVGECVIGMADCSCETLGRELCASQEFEHVIENAQGESNKAKRYYCYRCLALLLYPGVAHRQRVQLPACVEAAVKRRWPDAQGSYTGYHPS
jgi:hypothetical protein